jgi:hypothetical protein
MIEKIEKIQQEIGIFLVNMIPVEWDNIYFYAICETGYSDIYFCFKEKKTGIITSSDFFGNRYKKHMYHIDRSQICHTLLKDALKLYEAYKEEYGSGKIWYTMTYIVESSGKFKIDFTYEPLEDGMLERRTKWETKYFGHELPYIKEKYPYND